MPPRRNRGASTPDPGALASLSEDRPRLSRDADVDPVLRVGGTPPAEQTTPGPATPGTPASTSTNGAGHQPAGERPVRFGAYLKASVAEDVRDAVVALGGSWTIAAVMEGALVREVERLAQEHHGGRPFPPRDGRPLRVGRRIQ